MTSIVQLPGEAWLRTAFQGTRMTIEVALVLGIALVAVVRFATEKLRIDAVALLVLSSLAILGLINPGEALSGFSNQATVTVAAMFILAAGLQNSGALSGIGRLLGRAKSPFLFLRSEERRVGKEGGAL